MSEEYRAVVKMYPLNLSALAEIVTLDNDA